MPKFIITWNAGYGDNVEVVTADNQRDAQMIAYEMAREEFESSADYTATPLTKDSAEEYGLDVEAEEEDAA